MSTEMENITITVKVPFGSDRTVTTQPLVTIKDLTETIMATCQTESFREIPQCIVQSGRILPESSTLQQAGVSNGAVLHLMRRPRDQRRIPGRSPSSQSRSNDEEEEEDDDDEDDENEHDHEHETEHHVHTNVIIGHVAVDGRIRYSDAHDMLISVLHAVGFSTRAVRAAAAVAAAIAVATQSSEERGGASRTVLQNAWQATRRLQEQLSEETLPASPPTDSATASRTSTGTDQPAEVTASTATTSQTAEPVQISSGTGVEAPASSSQTSAPNTTSSNERTISALLPEGPPPTEEGETDLQASGRAANGLLPVLADALEVSASRLRNAPSMVDLEGSNRLEAAETLTEQLGSVASTVTFVTTLVSTLLPDPDDLRMTNRSNRNRNTGGAQRAEQSPQDDAEANQAERTTPSSQNENTNSSGTEGDRQSMPQTGRTGNPSSNEPPRGSRTRNSTDSENTSRSGSQLFGMFPAATSFTRTQRVSGSSRRIRRSRRIRVSSSQASNADFMIRVLSYYLCSISDLNIPAGAGPPEVDGQTAISVLDSLYGSNNTARPVNTFLRIIHFAMQKLTPRQFHEICRGNMGPLAAIRNDLWEEISRLVRGYHGSAVDTGEVKELFVDHICEALHEFVHVLESADEANEDGVFTPGPEDFCHHIMDIIQGKTEIFTDILAVCRSEEEFSGRMSRWVKEAIGEILLAITMELEMQWDGLLTSFRRAAYEIGKTVVGSQFSVIFPYVTNIFASRAKTSFERIASGHPDARHSHTERSAGQADTNGELNHSNCGPSCERQQAMLHEDSASRSHESDDDDFSHDETDSDMPELGEQDSDEGYDDDDEDNVADSDGGEEHGMYTGSGRNDRNAIIHDLDDAELRELANELDSEAKKTGVSTEVKDDLEEIDFEAMASELVAEVGSSITKSSESPLSRSEAKKFPAGTGKSIPVLSHGETTNQIRGASVNPPLSSSGSSSVNRATFSSAAVSREGSSSSGVELRNDFETILGAEDGLKWKQVINRDQARIRERRFGPLSRGYSGDTSVVQPLDSKRGSELAANAAREAAKKAKLSLECAGELERVASESGPQYMKEMEKAIGSRLRSDPDFNRQGFPRAAKRFLPES